MSKLIYTSRGPTLPSVVPSSPARQSQSGLVDECQLFLNPVVVGGGKRALPGHVRAELELLNERRFTSGVGYLHYRIGA